MRVSYGNISALLIEGIKELVAKNNEKDAIIAELQGSVASILARLNVWSHWCNNLSYTYARMMSYKNFAFDLTSTVFNGKILPAVYYINHSSGLNSLLWSCFDCSAWIGYHSQLCSPQIDNGKFAVQQKSYIPRTITSTSTDRQCWAIWNSLPHHLSKRMLLYTMHNHRLCLLLTRCGWENNPQRSRLHLWVVQFPMRLQMWIVWRYLVMLGWLSSSCMNLNASKSYRAYGLCKKRQVRFKPSRKIYHGSCMQQTVRECNGLLTICNLC